MTSLKSPANLSKPDFRFENSIDGSVCGLDEVGRGPLAGPVVAACVHVPENIRAFEWISEIRDSKKLSDKKLDYLYALIQEHCIWGIAECSPQEIDEINILQASLKAMAKSLDKTRQIFEHALVDGNHLPQLPCPATPVIKGDSKSVSIAAASILAKVTRDRYMAGLAKQHPHYGWERNVGYPSRQHMDAIDKFGITHHHRKSFAPVRNFIEFGSTERQVALAL